MSEQKQNLGMMIAGQVMTKNIYPGRDGKPDRYSLDVAIPNCASIAKISVDGPTYGAVQVLEVFKRFVSFRLYKGNVYFEALASV